MKSLLSSKREHFTTILRQPSSLLKVGLSLIALSPLVSAHALEYKSMTIRAATSSPNGGVHTYAIDKFKEIVEKESNGQIKVQTFYGGALGDEQSNVRQLRDQEIQLAVLAVGNLTPFAAQANIFSLPYMFPDTDAAARLFGDTAFTDKIGETIAKQSGARPLSWLIGGYRHITNSKHPITKIDDLKGLKIRVPSVDVQLDAFRSWGVEPHPLAWAETFNALQQGVVDGQENPYSVNRDNKFWEVQKYVTEIPYMLWVGPMLVSEQWFRRLDQPSKELVTKAARAAAEAEWQYAEKLEAQAKKECVDHGMQVSTPTDGLIWQEKARAIWPKFYKQIGGKSMMDEAQEIMSKKS
ncbi:C4-dicarboxylate ABC transporter substrate-binding protein [Advenella sp. S44]|uniref:TRAP transporter substrate-binding protein n=1 Tax=Advenella sp. S44 TaxID=1982755 RepID=UPI000C2B24C4|nr:TRAP transporter substrate-binding protein [Advenella sp. S44]PJX25289.1 C4-dicarboxylate ABC transporter substrate-binding protein [Advenella sp. S44]